MIDNFDIQKLQDLPIEQVAEALGLGVSRHKCLCPFHADSRPSLTFNRGKNRYRCYVCDARGGSIDLVMNTQGWKFREACQWLAHEFGIILGDDSGSHLQQVRKQVRAAKATPEPAEKPDLPYLTRLMSQPVINEQAARFLYAERKIKPEVVRQLGLSSISYSCPMSSSPKPSYFDGPALLIPYRDCQGNLISVQSRYLGTGDRPRFRFPKGSQCHIFNLDILGSVKEGEPLFLTEGVSDCLAVMSAGYKAIAIPSATLLKPQDVEVIRYTLLSKHSTLHMYPDQDEPGERLFESLCRLIDNSSACGHHFSIVRHQLPSGFKDIGAYYAYLH